MSKTNNHPLFQVMQQYMQDWSVLKDAHTYLDCYEFNTRYGFVISVPPNWPVIEASCDLIDVLAGKRKSTSCSVAVVYSDKKTHDVLNSHLSSFQTSMKSYFVSWHEIYVAMKRQGEDVRFLKTIQERISAADVVLFLGAKDVMNEVIGQVRAITEGCLITLDVI